MVQRSVLHMVGALADLVSSSRRVLSADQLIAAARHRTDLQEFGETPFMEALLRFLRACVEEAELSPVGRIATRWDVVRFLSNLLLLHHEERKTPAILTQAVARPIFVSGLPRSGTTFLHSLLAEDPGNLVPRVWQLIHPYLGKDGDDHLDPVIRRVARQLRLFGLLSPDFRRMHPIDARSPQECSEITAHVFASLRFDSTYR